MRRRLALVVIALLVAAAAAAAEDAASVVAAQADGVVVLRGAQVGGPVPPPEPPAAPAQAPAPAPSPALTLVLVPIETQRSVLAPTWGFLPGAYASQRHHGSSWRHPRPHGRRGHVVRYRNGFRNYVGSVSARGGSGPARPQLRAR